AAAGNRRHCHPNHARRPTPHPSFPPLPPQIKQFNNHAKTRQTTRQTDGTYIMNESAGRLRAIAKITRLVRPGQVDVKGLHRRADSSNDLAGPERRAEERHPAVLRFTHGAKGITLVSGLISIDSSLRQITLKPFIR